MRIDLGYFKNWFDDYLTKFKSEETDLRRNLLLKEEHTRRVCREILSLGEKLNLCPADLRLAEVMALFHDIGRFQQYARYRTFIDRDSVDHADLGVRILKRERVLRRLDPEKENLIFRVISYHNQPSLPPGESKKCLFFTRLLRDADKLDIWKVVIDYYQNRGDERNPAIELGLPDTPGISGEVYRSLLRQEIVSVDHLRNLNDFKLLQVGWIFSVNFQPTFAEIRKRKYINLLRSHLPASKDIEIIFSLVDVYLARAAGD